jgi:hypothetical protein
MNNNARGCFARKNDATKANVHCAVMHASGAFKNVYKGVYTIGERQGEQCVAKRFKSGSVFENAYFDVELKVVAKSLEIINNFNNDGLIDKPIWLNEPTVWEFEESKEKVLVEPFIDNFEKFNSNTGWTPNQSTPWIEVMQALSHYSYQVSQRALMICDLQGGSYKDGFIITDPVIMSTAREYGPADLGPQGISTFFARHRCNKFCKTHWLKPSDKTAYYQEQESSMMVLPTRSSRPTLRY